MVLLCVFVVVAVVAVVFVGGFVISCRGAA
jgi:hypothetical protein